MSIKNLRELIKNISVCIVTQCASWHYVEKCWTWPHIWRNVRQWWSRIYKSDRGKIILELRFPILFNNFKIILVLEKAILNFPNFLLLDILITSNKNVLGTKVAEYRK